MAKWSLLRTTLSGHEDKLSSRPKPLEKFHIAKFHTRLPKALAGA